MNQVRAICTGVPLAISPAGIITLTVQRKWTDDSHHRGTRTLPMILASPVSSTLEGVTYLHQFSANADTDLIIPVFDESTTAVAHNPVPQDIVSPTPRSFTRMYA